MKGNFDKCLPLVLVHEGGYVNHPKDPGGATNKGITHRTYAAWRKRTGQPAKHVKDITDEEVAAIYRVQYWQKVMGDDLPSGVDYAVFDFAVNSGPARAAKFLQKVVGVPDDGIIGAQTLAAVAAKDPSYVINRLCGNRLSWLKRLKTFSTFGRGWTRRVKDVQENALAMKGDLPIHQPKQAASGRADGEEKITATISDLAKDPKTWGAGMPILGSLVALAEGQGPVQWAIAAAVVIFGLTYAYMKIREKA